MEKQQSVEHWPKMDFINGQVKTYFSLIKNQIHTRQYSFNFTVLISIIYAIIHPASLILLSTLILILIIQEASPFSISMYAIELALLVLASIVRQILGDKAKAEADDLINKRTVKVCQGEDQEFKEIEWGELKQGDIIYLTQGEIAPADIVILDSQSVEHRQAITYVDMKSVNGDTVCQKKKACYLTQIVNKSSTQKRFWPQYRKIITGRVTYEKPNAVMDTFTGYLKLSKDPKLQKLSIDNLILRQSCVKTSLWVYGLVIYPGMDSKIMKSFKEGNKSRNWIITRLDKIYFAMLLINILLGTIFTLVYKLSEERMLSNVFIVSYHFLMFSIVLPHLLYLAKDIYLILFKFSCKNNQIEVRNYENMQELGEVTFSVISNVGVLTTGKLEVNEIVTQSSVYALEGEDLNSFSGPKRPSGFIPGRRRLGSSMRADEGLKTANKKQLLLPIMNYDKRNSALMFKEQKNRGQIEQNFQIDDDTNVRAKQSPNFAMKSSKMSTHLQPLKLDRNRFYNYVKRNQNESIQIIKALSLCHQAKLKYMTNKNKYQGVSNVNSEQVLLKLVKYVGWQIQPNIVEKKQIGLKILQQKQRINQNGTYVCDSIANYYDWCGINSFHTPRKLFSVVVRHQNQYTLYCKGRPEDIIERLKISKETHKIIEQTIASYDKKQSEVLIYAKKILTEEEKQFYQNDYISLKSSLTTTQAEIDSFSKKYEKDLEFICIIGMSTQVNPRAEALVKYLKDSGIKPCMFTQEKSQLNSLKSMLLDDIEGHQHIQLEQGSAELIKYYLNEATNLLHNNKEYKYILTLNGIAWQTILSNSQILQHFLFVLYYSQGLLATKLTPQDIAILTNRIRNSYPETQKVLGIGYSFKDLKFLGESNVSIGLSSDLPTDVKIYCLDKIMQALNLGPYFLDAKATRRSLILYRVVTLSTIILVYQILLSALHSSQTLNAELVFLYSVIYTCLELGYSVFQFKQTSKQGTVHQQQSRRSSEMRVMIACAQAFIHGLIIILSVYYTLPNVKVQNSKILPIQALDMSIFIILILVGSIRNVFNPKNDKSFFAMTTLITFSVMILLVFLISIINPDFQRVSSQFINIFSAYDSITMIINVSILCLTISMFIEEIVKKNIELFWKKDSKASDAKSCSHKRQQITRMIKHLYQQEDHMDYSLQQIVSKELDVNRMKISRNLQIKDQEQNIKYLSQSIPKTRQSFIKICLLLFALNLIILIMDLSYTHKKFKNQMILLLVGMGIAIGSILIVWKGEMYMCYYRFTTITIFLMSTLLLVFSFFASSYVHFLICLIGAIITQPLNLIFPLLVIQSIAVVICGIVPIQISQSFDVVDKVVGPIFQIICIILNFKLIYQGEVDSRISFIITEAFQKERNYVNDILSILVPKFIKNHLQENDFTLQQEQKKVSILFCYVCNFDQIVKEEGTNVVPLMDQLFRQFDQFCHNYAVQKIQTVGQTYMAATGISAYEDEIQTEMKKKNQVERLLKMAIQMLDKSKDIMWGTKKNKKLNIKIGIHHGSVVIGVIGYHKPQFSLIGDSVNTTSRHCSTANPGQIVVSTVAYNLLRKFPASAFKKQYKKMKGLGQNVPVYKYTKNQLKESNHLKVRVKFQNIVKKVIENLKMDGKIVHKKFEASQLAKIALVNERRNTRNKSRVSELRRSLEAEAILHADYQSNQDEELREMKNSQLQLKYNMFLELKEKNVKFIKHLLRKYLSSDRLMLSVLAVVYGIIFLIDIGTSNFTSASLSLSCIGLVMFPILFFLNRGALKNRLINVFVVAVHIYLILIMKARTLMVKEQKGQIILQSVQNFYPIIAITICSSQSIFRFLHTLLLCIVAIVMSIIILAIHKQFEPTIVIEVFYFAFILIRKYQYLKKSYQNFSQAEIYEKKTQEQSALVSQLLPKHAYEKLKNQNIENRLELTDRFEKATILFADIKGFTEFSNQSTPVGVVKMLRKLFEDFDKLCLKYNVYKVYTIGDCYVVLGFTNCYQRDYLQQAKNVVNMGLAMIETIQRVRQELNFDKLDMRIGIHTGTIIGGIIGTQIVRYDIYGPDVMVANKFEEFGVTGCIHISQSTKEILDQDKKKCFNITKTKQMVKIEKLSAEYNGYLLTKKKFEM